MSKNCILLSLLFLACRHEPAGVSTPAPIVVEASVSSDAGRAFGPSMKALSEPARSFLSDNWISNETSYLQIKNDLRTGGAYIGVGPEQNFSYIALTKPEIAFVLDLRRENTVLHLFYKALFELAPTREEFRRLLIGGPDPRIRERVGEFLEPKDDIDAIARGFHEKGMQIRFEMKEKNGRAYPTLESLLDQDGSFLSSDERYRTVRTMQLEDRVVPVVGDFAGPHAVKAIGDELRRRNLKVNAFYVSNVEQYVMLDGKWKAWLENIRALPHDEKSVFVRCYLDQGKPHPKQMKGHRTATVLQTFDRFESRSWGSWFELASDTML